LALQSTLITFLTAKLMPINVPMGERKEKIPERLEMHQRFNMLSSPAADCQHHAERTHRRTHSRRNHSIVDLLYFYLADGFLVNVRITVIVNAWRASCKDNELQATGHFIQLSDD
jgi:hypothetical protein